MPKRCVQRTQGSFMGEIHYLVLLFIFMKHNFSKKTLLFDWINVSKLSDNMVRWSCWSDCKNAVGSENVPSNKTRVRDICITATKKTQNLRDCNNAVDLKNTVSVESWLQKCGRVHLWYVPLACICTLLFLECRRYYYWSWKWLSVSLTIGET